MSVCVYLIDDDPAVLASTELLLGVHGIDSRSFASPRHFLDCVADLAPACIISDLRMPGMTGIEMHTALLARGFDWPIIFLSGNADVPSVVQAVKQGAVEFIEKPASEQALLAAISSCTAKLRSCQQAEVERIRTALQQDRIYPCYQPKFDLLTGALTGLEALMRWTSDAPHTACCGTAIHQAFEDKVLGRALSGRMLDAVLADMARWRASGVEVGAVSINASACDLEDECFASDLIRRLQRFGIPHSDIQIEVTEMVTLDLKERGVIGTLQQLDSAGIRIALDDFGTGFASLTHLQTLPVHVIKIDRSFVARLPGGASASIVRAIIGLAKGLAKEVVAEGVETCAQAEFLRRSGCDQAQGFLFGAPVPASAIPGIASVPRASGNSWDMGWSSRARLAS